MSINLDLVRDWKEIMLQEIEQLKKSGFAFPVFDEWKSLKLQEYQRQKEQFASKGMDTSSIEKLMTDTSLKTLFESESLITYHNLLLRVSEPRPRKLKYSKSFHCPSHLQAGLNLVVNKIQNGESLFPHVSRRIFNANEQDGMLFDWGIHHFHLGAESDPNNPKLIKGTREVLYAMLKDDIAYLLVIDDHGRWADIELLNIIKHDFPEAIEQYKIKIEMHSKQTIDGKERLQLRKAGVSTFTDIDGEYYFSPGGGINSAGGSFYSTTKYINTARLFEKLNEILLNAAEEKRADIEAHTGLPLEKITAKMNTYENNTIVVTDEKANFKTTILLDEKWNNVKSIIFS